MNNFKMGGLKMNTKIHSLPAVEKAIFQSPGDDLALLRSAQGLMAVLSNHGVPQLCMRVEAHHLCEQKCLLTYCGYVPEISGFCI